MGIGMWRVPWVWFGIFRDDQHEQFVVAVAVDEQYEQRVECEQ
jgi:hypothetical protein